MDSLSNLYGEQTKMNEQSKMMHHLIIFTIPEMGNYRQTKIGSNVVHLKELMLCSSDLNRIKLSMWLSRIDTRAVTLRFELRNTNGIESFSVPGVLFPAS